MAVSSIEIAAVVGAAAWVPHVITWIYKAATRPRLTIIPEKTASIGFTNYGPILNVRLAIAVDRKDVILTKLGVELTHEAGERREFSWRSMAETFSTIRDNSGVERGSYERDQAAIALKVTTSTLVEKFFRFQEDKFSEHVKPLMEEAIAHQKYLETQKTDYHDGFLKSEKYCALVDAHRGLFWWRAGKYRVRIVAESSQKHKLPKARFEFQLSQSDVDALRSNLDWIQQTYESQVKRGLPGYTAPIANWAWRDPALMSA